MSVKVYSATDFPPYLPKLNLLYDDLFSHGKGLRSKLVTLVCSELKALPKVESLLCQTIEFIHNASLLHDDLVDRSELRRNKPAAWLKYSPEYAVLAGDYLLARVMVNLSSFGNISLISFTSHMISDLLEGEWIQDSLLRDWDLTLSDLDRVHHLKTGSLFRWCLQAPFLAMDQNTPETEKILNEIGTILGLLFQRSDDLLDFDVRNKEKKAVLGDLKSGYLNSFAAYLCQSLPPPTKARFVQCQSLEEIGSLLGESFFQNQITSFDQLNEELIKIYQHHLDHLKKLRPDLSELVKKLGDLPKLLYWRQ